MGGWRQGKSFFELGWHPAPACSALGSFPPRMDQFWELWEASAGLEVPSYTPEI